MSDAVLTFADPGPFDRITAFGFPTLTYRLRIVRDDGLLFSPQGEEGVEIILYDDTWEFLFAGNSWADPHLDFIESIPGLIVRFAHSDEHYLIALNLNLVREVLQRNRNDLRLYVVTDGSRTLETAHPRCYTSSQEPWAISPGDHEIRIPFWDQVTVQSRPDPLTLLVTTTHYSSVPYTADYRIASANALGWFHFPVLGVTWSPNESLTGWRHQLELTLPCPGSGLFIPSQTIEGLTPPSNPPASPEDRVSTFHTNLSLALALDACHALWDETRIAVTTNFGCAETIPFAPTPATQFNATFTLPGVQPPTALFGRLFTRSHRFLWNQTGFDYDTGHWPTYYSSRAILAQSPRSGSDALHFHPEPE